MVVRFWYFARRNVTSWREHALHFSVNDFYCRNSHICVLVKICGSL